MPVTVAVIDDYPLVVAGLSAILEPHASRVRLRPAQTQNVADAGFDVVLHDPAASPSGASVDLQTLSGSIAPKLAIFSWLSEPARMNAAVAYGAYAQFSKALRPDDLVNAIEQVHRGERIGMQMTGVATADKGQWPGAEHGLSGRESEILMWVCQGVSNREISDRAYIGINTVKTYIRSAYRKIGAQTRSQAVIWAMANGFGPADDATPWTHPTSAEGPVGGQ